ncbi:hypothetical protein Ddc_16357 [Ditylenchus destructor]|nr:hypothetical protein Ddc_16357 [Ditylenchus destructor]
METSGAFNIYKLKKLYITTKSQVQVYVNDGFAGVIELPGRMEHSSVGNVKRAVENHLMIKLNPARTEIDMDDSEVKVRIRNDTIWKNVEVIRTPANDHQLQSQQVGEQKKLLALKIDQNNGEHVWESVMKLYGSDIAEIQDENGTTIFPRQDDPQFSCPLGSSCPFMSDIPTQVNIANLKTLYVVSEGTVVEKVHTDIVGNQCDEIFLGEYAFESNIWSKVIAKWKWVEEFGKITTGSNVSITKDGNKLLKTAGLTLVLKQKTTYIASDTTLYYK